MMGRGQLQDFVMQSTSKYSKEIPEVIVSGQTQNKLYSDNMTNTTHAEGQSNTTEMMYSYSLEGTKL